MWFLKKNILSRESFSFIMLFLKQSSSLRFQKDMCKNKMSIIIWLQGPLRGYNSLQLNQINAYLNNLLLEASQGYFSNWDK